MSTTLTSVAQGLTVTNLDTYVYTVGTATMHVAKIMVPVIPPSGMTITIKQNSSTIASFSSPAASQSVINLAATMNCVVNDTISFILASSTATDKAVNSFKAQLNIHIGSSN